MLYMFQAVPPPIIRSSNCIYSIGYFVKPFQLSAIVVEETTVAGSRKGLTKYPVLYIHIELLMMGGGTT